MSTKKTNRDDMRSLEPGQAVPLTGQRVSRLSITQIRSFMPEIGADDTVLALLESDPRAGVRQLAVRRRRELARESAEADRLEAMLRMERRYWGRGLVAVAGVDEVGRGCLAGPVVAAAVILPPEWRAKGLDDSKRMTAAHRTQMDAQIRASAVDVGLGTVEAGDIDRINIRQSSLLAMRMALGQLAVEPQQVLVDGNTEPGSGWPETVVVDGDARCLCIAAASVVAKVYRDRLMVKHHEEHPCYGFASNKGYGSAQHLEALQRYGPCPLHRRSFAPVAQALSTGGERSCRYFHEQLRHCASLQDLQRLGTAIRGASHVLEPGQLETLRSQYKRAQARLSAVGARGEALAAQQLEDAGYRVLARQYRAAGGEIDLVAQGAGELVFVEVKTRATVSLGRPEERVDHDKRTRLIRAARHFVQHRTAVDQACRFDVLAVDLSGPIPRVEHWQDAFQA